MTANDAEAGAETTTFSEDLAEITRLLTAIARRTHLRGNGEETRHDFGEIISIVVTATAANLGGVEELLAGRPGSWEADYVRQIVNSTALPRELNQYRTEPVKLVFNPEDLFDDVGLRGLFDDEDDELASGYHNGTEPDDGGVHDGRIDDKRVLLEQIYKADLDKYFDEYVATLKEIAIERGITVPVEVERVTEFVEPEWGSLAESLHAAARERTPLPSGIALADYPSSNVAKAEREAQRSYLDRLADQL